MNLAIDLKLPAVIHSRDAAADTLDMIKAIGLEKVGGVIHCFSYGKEMAKAYVDMGFYLGIGGVVTFKNGKKTKRSGRIYSHRIISIRNGFSLSITQNQAEESEILPCIYRLLQKQLLK